MERRKYGALSIISIFNTVNNLGILYKDHGKLAEAKQINQRALNGYQKLRRPNHPSTIRIRYNSTKHDHETFLASRVSSDCFKVS